MSIKFIAMPDDIVSRYRGGASDANGQTPELRTAIKSGLPCRHCMQLIEAGERYLTLAHRPFPSPQPYAELGPIFLHADVCKRGGGTSGIPPFLASPAYIVRGYGCDDRIVYGTGQIVETQRIPATAEAIFADRSIAYLHVRSATNNCYHCRIERA